MLAVFRLLILSLVLFSSGAIIGWWFHLRYPVPLTTSGSHELPKRFTVEPFTLEPQPFSSDVSIELQEFNQALNEGRTEDALTLYQQHERSGSPLVQQLRTILLNKIQLWQNQKNHDAITAVLEQFIQYYYQDTELLNILAAAYETSGQTDKAIETLLATRPYVDDKESIQSLESKIHNLAKSLFERHQKNQTLVHLVSLLQKLAYLEPDYSFYRFALASAYIAVGDIDNAIRELEILQLDPEYGKQASRLLVTLLPPPLPVEDEPDSRVTSIPLTGSGGHYIVNSVAGDQYAVNLLIDTGSTFTTLPSRVLKELRRNNKATRIAHAELNTANGSRMTPIYRLKEFQVGDYMFEDLDVAELELNTPGAEGLLGMNVLEKFHFFIDQNLHTLTLTPR